MFVLTRSEELDISEGESCYSSVRRCSDRRSLSECNVIHVVRICLTSLRQLQRRLADAVEIKATQLTANAGTTLDFIFLHFLFRGFFFFSLSFLLREKVHSTLSHITRPAYGEERRRYLTFFSHLSGPQLEQTRLGLCVQRLLSCRERSFASKQVRATTRLVDPRPLLTSEATAAPIIIGIEAIGAFSGLVGAAAALRSSESA